MTTLEKELREEYYRVDLKSEFHRAEKARYDKRKEEIMRQINDPDFKLAMKDIVAEK